MSPRRAAPPGPAESLNCGQGRPPICPGWSRALSRAKTWRRRSRGSATSSRASERTLPATQGREPPSAACSLGAKLAASPRGGRREGRGREPKGRMWEPGATHLPSPGASFSGVPRCGPPPPRQVLSPAGRCRSPGPQASQPVPAGNDCKSTLLFELPLGPQHRSPPVRRDGAPSRQPPGAGTEPGYYRASGRSLPGGC